MALITLRGNKIHTNGELPSVGSQAPDFVLVNGELKNIKLENFKGKKVKYVWRSWRNYSEARIIGVLRLQTHTASVCQTQSLTNRNGLSTKQQ